jgi:hypothetical protein
MWRAALASSFRLPARMRRLLSRAVPFIEGVCDCLAALLMACSFPPSLRRHWHTQLSAELCEALFDFRISVSPVRLHALRDFGHCAVYALRIVGESVQDHELLCEPLNLRGRFARAHGMQLSMNAPPGPHITRATNITELITAALPTVLQICQTCGLHLR